MTSRLRKSGTAESCVCLPLSAQNFRNHRAGSVPRGRRGDFRADATTSAYPNMLASTVGQGTYATGSVLTRYVAEATNTHSTRSRVSPSRRLWGAITPSKLKRHALPPTERLAERRRNRSDDEGRRGSGCQRFGFRLEASSGASVGRHPAVASEALDVAGRDSRPRSRSAPVQHAARA